MKTAATFLMMLFCGAAAWAVTRTALGGAGGGAPPPAATAVEPGPARGRAARPAPATTVARAGAAVAAPSDEQPGIKLPPLTGLDRALMKEGLRSPAANLHRALIPASATFFHAATLECWKGKERDMNPSELRLRLLVKAHPKGATIEAIEEIVVAQGAPLAPEVQSCVERVMRAQLPVRVPAQGMDFASFEGTAHVLRKINAAQACGF
jgi:hypothetical protein